MRNYETMFIIDANLTEEAIEGVVEKMTSLIADNNGEVVNVDNWGKKELAYEIDKQTVGYYTLVNFKGDADTVAELERVYKIDDNVIRYLILKDE
ncbi:30S ribosomal protein S6 [Halonatronum saccharophilum]|uniref:30S ribosomal protein S6 n=1 Tax=Halonatronum saccharophilum TaxID=150060 RepID=UPI0004818F5E|nr:30S ribosomal protein S6 [Halonatronum saccharophilum]